VALWPVVAHYIHYSIANGYVQPVTVLTRFSVELTALVKVPAWQAVWSQSGYRGLTSHESAAFPGLVATALAVAAVRGPNGADRNATRLALVMTGAFFILSLGPRLMLRENTPVPFAWWIPLPGRFFEVFSVIRWPMRALTVSLLFGAVLCGLGFTALTSRMSSAKRLLACALATALIVVEYRPADRLAGDSIRVPDPLDLSGAYTYLASENDRGAVVELPTADTNGYRTPMLVRSTYGSAGHLRRVVAIHGQNVPQLAQTLLAEAEALPDPGVAARLRSYGCSRLVVHRTWSGGDALESTVTALRTYLPVLWESDEAVVFDLTARVVPAKSADARTR